MLRNKLVSFMLFFSIATSPVVCFSSVLPHQLFSSDSNSGSAGHITLNITGASSVTYVPGGVINQFFNYFFYDSSDCSGFSTLWYNYPTDAFTLNNGISYSISASGIRSIANMNIFHSFRISFPKGNCGTQSTLSTCLAIDCSDTQCTGSSEATASYTCS